ncbi:hypothetical protein Ciccas_010059, partial [Cichlidogyrus casuarinus]
MEWWGLSLISPGDEYLVFCKCFIRSRPKYGLNHAWAPPKVNPGYGPGCLRYRLDTPRKLTLDDFEFCQNIDPIKLLFIIIVSE